MKKAPIIGIICCNKKIEGQLVQSVHHKYINAILDFEGTPILLPAQLSESHNFQGVLDMLDGVLLTGSYSNIAPHHYNSPHDEKTLDESRDNLSFRLIDYAETKNMPLLAICRGLQEMNVYFGGTLYPNLLANPAFVEQHLEQDGVDTETQYESAHKINIESNSILSECGSEFKINSLHKQAIKELAPSLRIEACAPDGLIEAISHPKQDFMVGVQWHPEWKSKDNQLSTFLFTKFIDKANVYRNNKKHKQ